MRHQMLLEIASGEEQIVLPRILHSPAGVHLLKVPPSAREATEQSCRMEKGRNKFSSALSCPSAIQEGDGGGSKKDHNFLRSSRECSVPYRLNYGMEHLSLATRKAEYLLCNIRNRIRMQPKYLFAVIDNNDTTRSMQSLC